MVYLRNQAGWEGHFKSLVAGVGVGKPWEAGLVGGGGAGGGCSGSLIC